MIEQIGLVNFKSHEKTIINLCSGVNTIYGDPQAGKSNILKGLELLKENRPIGAKFMPKWAGKKCETHVYILDDAGVKIGIKVNCSKTKSGKTKRESTYYYIEDTTAGKLWDSTGVGKEVPPEITKALNLSEINIQLQKDPPFMATDSGSKISKTVNQITGLDLGDKLSKVLTKQYNEQTAVIRSIRAELDDETKKLKTYEKFSKLGLSVGRLDMLCSLIDKTDDRINSLRNYVFKLDDLSRSIHVPEIIDEIYKAQAAGSKAAVLKDQISDLKGRVEKIEKIEKVRACPHLGAEFKRLARLNLIINEAHAVIKVMKRAVMQKADYKKTLTIKESYLKIYLDLLSELKKCPVCFQNIDDKSLEQIKGGL